MSTEAAKGSHKPFDKRIHEVRGHPAQIDMATHYRSLLTDTSIKDSHTECEKVQDPYSLRCQPQVMGACLQQIRNAAEIILIEANAVSDNPLIFLDNNEIISGGWGFQPFIMTIFEYSISGSGSDQGLDYIEP